MPFNFKEVNFNTKKVSSQIVDTSTPGFLWIGFEKNENNVCKLLKVSTHNLKQTYYNIDISVDRIVDMTILNSQIFVAVEDDTIMGRRYNIFTPLSNNEDINYPTGINEKPVAITFSGFYIYFLFPGIASGEFAKIVKVNQSGVFQETLIMDQSGETINYASTMTSDGTDLWVVTSENPANLIRVTGINTGPMDYEVTPLITP